MLTYKAIKNTENKYYINECAHQTSLLRAASSQHQKGEFLLETYVEPSDSFAIRGTWGAISFLILFQT